MDFSDMFWLSVVVLLSAFLYFKDDWRRYKERRASELRRAIEDDQTGHDIDVFHLTNRLQEVRSNFPAATHSDSNNNFRRKSLIASARRFIGQLPYFERRSNSNPASAEQEADGH